MGIKVISADFIGICAIIGLLLAILIGVSLKHGNKTLGIVSLVVMTVIFLALGVFSLSEINGLIVHKIGFTSGIGTIIKEHPEVNKIKVEINLILKEGKIDRIKPVPNSAKPVLK